MLKLPNQVQCC